jgi:hypothetical protein
LRRWLFHWVTLARSVALVLSLLMLRVRPRLGIAPKINP